MMKKFLIKLALFFSLALVFTGYVVFKIGGSFDHHYLRFTSGRQQSLILGTSRAARGIQPKVLNKRLQGKQFYNFAFNANISPYGPVYFRAIKKKLDPKASQGIYILVISPIHFLNELRVKDDTLRFRELSRCLAKTKYVNLNPNVFYLLNNYENFIYEYLRNFNQDKWFLHDDGWLEVNAGTKDPKVLTKRRNNVAKRMKSNVGKVYFSEIRWQYFIKTIQLLKKHGEVYLVRLPVDKQILDIEDKYMPGFDTLIDNAFDNNVPYFDMTHMADDFIFNDGSHLNKKSSEEVSRLIGEWILSTNAQNP